MKKQIFMIAVMIFIIISCKSGGSKDVITINAGPQPKTIDPSLNTALDGCYYIIHAFEGLTTKSKDGKIVGGAAENWEILDNGTKYIFHLRTNAKWSDGKPVIASDFVYSWQRVVDPAVGSQYSFQHEPVKNAKAITAGKMPVDRHKGFGRLYFRSYIRSTYCIFFGFGCFYNILSCKKRYSR